MNSTAYPINKQNVESILFSGDKKKKKNHIKQGYSKRETLAHVTNRSRDKNALWCKLNKRSQMML